MNAIDIACELLRTISAHELDAQISTARARLVMLESLRTAQALPVEVTDASAERLPNVRAARRLGAPRAKAGSNSRTLVVKGSGGGALKQRLLALPVGTQVSVGDYAKESGFSPMRVSQECRAAMAGGRMAMVSRGVYRILAEE